MLVVLSLAACGSGGPDVASKACTSMGLDPSGVSVNISGLSTGSGVAIVVCTPLKCTTANQKYTDAYRSPVPNAGIKSVDPVKITVTVRDAAGQVLVPKKTLTVTPMRNQPNGAGCNPIGYFATVDVAASSAAANS